MKKAANIIPLRRIHNLLFPKVGEIWMLHGVVGAAGDTVAGRLEVDLDRVTRKIDALLQMGMCFCSIGDVPGRVSTRQSFVSVTFDDGYLDTYTLAYPALKARNIPFCVYATRDFYMGMAWPQWSPSAKMMSSSQLKELSLDPLCTIGVHTCTHPHLDMLPAETQRQELAVCKQDLEQLIGREVVHMAYPHGDYNQITVGLCRELGFVTAVAANGRTVRTDSRPLELERVDAAVIV
ncbi:MAG: polysaccharide deacetylase family protein [Bacteroidales bacterium]|nr:polysaccharide deacetylase family protein [Bacteroidales bacterium]